MVKAKAKVSVIGAGLAGSEAAWQLANRGIQVDLFEMRPEKQTKAHNSNLFAELVCSNSFRSNKLTNAVGLLKEEMRRLDSLIMQVASQTKVPAGGALAVDRTAFAKKITEKIENHPLINIIRKEVKSINLDQITIVAAGPLCSNHLTNSLESLIKEQYLHFFDAAAPILTKESIDFNKAFFGSRYEDGQGDYINCPLNKDEYDEFYQQLINAELQEIKDFEKGKIFEGCMPIEEMAKRGEQTLLFGPMKPVGISSKDCDSFHAVVQLRQDNESGSLFNMVGFQTRLKWNEQKRVFRMIPALAEAEFVRLGVMHRNTFINSTISLLPTGQLKNNLNTFVAGQISGVEGYVESAASGIICGINAARLATGKELVIFPTETAHGSLMNYITSNARDDFQPMNITFGLIPSLSERIRKRRERRLKISDRALTKLDEFIKLEELKIK